MLPELEKNRSLLQNALTIFSEFYLDEGQYVNDYRAKHHIALSGGNILEAPTPGTFCPRTPSGVDIEYKIMLTRGVRIASFCMDYEQAATFADKANARVYIVTAGGAAQPDEGRFSAMVKLFRVINEVNPSAVFILGGHNNLCLGANYFTDGDLEAKHKINPALETGLMMSYVKSMGQALVNRGVNPRSIELRFARVDRKRLVSYEKI